MAEEERGEEVKEVEEELEEEGMRLIFIPAGGGERQSLPASEEDSAGGKGGEGEGEFIGEVEGEREEEDRKW